MTALETKLISALNRLCKWRSIFCGWQLGTRVKDDPEAQAVRDHREVTMLLRAEFNAMLILLVDKKVFTTEEFQAQLIEEAEFLSKQYEEKFPGCVPVDDGMKIDPQKANYMRNWRP
jgi:hypothetical protein